MNDSVDHPEHYQHGQRETIYTIREALSREAFEGFLAGNIIKYIARHRWKGDVEDLRKAQWYLDYLIGERSGTNI